MRLITVLIKSRILEDLNILHKYFNNLKCLNFTTYVNLSVAEIVQIYNNWKINLTIYNSSRSIFDYYISSKYGYLVLYDGHDHIYISFKSFRLDLFSSCYEIQDDYVIFYYNNEEVELEVEEVTDHCQEHNCVNFELIDQPSIIIHKKYINKLCINRCFDNNHNFEPTQSLELLISDSFSNKSKSLMQYLNTHSFDKLYSEVKFSQ